MSARSAYIAIATAALGLLPVSGALAGNTNTLYLTQSGTSNTADVQQAAGPGGNDIGTLALPFMQIGNTNSFTEVQALGGGFFNGDNDILKAKQLGNGNDFYDYYSNNAGFNRINDVLQYGDSNVLNIGRNNQRYGTVGTVIQGGYAADLVGGNDNGIAISQTTYYLSGGFPVFSGGNEIALVTQIGSHNRGYGYAVYGTTIEQDGSQNKIFEASIVGSNNTSGLNPIAQYILQQGVGNGQTASTARTLGSNGNAISVTEIGNWNNFSVQQGLSAASTGNYATVSQTGSFNNATATQFGNGNHLVITQLADNNSATANFTGDDNGVGSMSGVAGALVSANSSSLTQGTILQNSTSAAGSNTVTYNVFGSSNLFAFAQIGGGNTITGSVGTGVLNSAHNQAAVLQVGNNNTASFSQTGVGSNIASISQ